MFIIKLIKFKFFSLVVSNSHMAVFPKSKNADFRQNHLLIL